MKLARKLTLSLILGILAVMTAHAYFQVRQEVTLSQGDLLRARRVGLAWLGTIEAVWEHEGPARVQDLVKRANERAKEGQPDTLKITLRVIPMNDLAAQAALPLSEEQRELLKSGKLVRTMQEDEEGRQWGHIYVALTVAGTHPAIVALFEPMAQNQTFIHMSHMGLAFGTLGVVSVCGLIVIGLHYWLVARPIQLLRDKARRAGQGDFTGPLRVDQNDEIGDLAHDINAMCDQINEANSKLNAETEARMAALEQLRHTDRLATVGQLAAGVAHELGTPLNVVSARAEMLATTPPSQPEVVRNAKVIVEQCDRMAAIIQQLLDFSRRRGGNLALADLRHVVTRTLELLSMVVRKAGVEWRCDAPQTPVLVRMDQNQMQQALANIILNGIQAMANGGRLHVRVTGPPAPGERTAGAEGEGVRVVIEDDGAGIAPEHLERVFEPFFTTKKVGEGTGLGLAVARGIVAEHGGRITVDSVVGRGARFTILLPSAADDPSAARGAA